MSKRLEQFMGIKKALEDAKATLQSIKEMGGYIIEQSYDRSSFESGITRAVEGIARALEQMDDQTIGFLGSENPSEPNEKEEGDE